MGLVHLLRALARRPVVVVVGLALTIGALLLGEAARDGVHHVRAGVVLAPPDATVTRNPLYGREYSIIATAGLVTRMANAGDGGARTSSSRVSLTGTGETDGYSLTLHNDGGQWVNDYDRPVIDVQAVGPTAAAAARNYRRAMADLDARLTELQDGAGVAASARLRLQAVPDEPGVEFASGRPWPARVATVLLGAALVAGAVLTLDARDARRARRHAPPGPSGLPARYAPGAPPRAVPVLVARS